ncbi:hypothetical protein OQI88_13600, partial [Lactococcus lactis]|nr:hypothetical protein [Lactococcus lactis]
MSNKKCPNCGYELDSWNDCVSVNNILECPECEEHFELKAIRLNKPHLTIPKSIADELDKVPFHNPNENGYICVAYLAGKALGVDLVKVVEGI